jgi:hypothetical protein
MLKLEGSGVQIAPPRPKKTRPLFAMPGSGPASAPVASCGVLRLLEALDSYNFDYTPFGHEGDASVSSLDSGESAGFDGSRS